FVFIVSGPHLLELVFGMGYKGAWAPLAVLCVGGTVSCLLGSPALILNMTHNESRVVRASGVSMAILIVLVPSLTYALGIVGTALATTVALLAWKLVLWRDCCTMLGLDP